MRGADRLVLSPRVLFRAAFALTLVITIFALTYGVFFEGERSILIGANAVPFLFVLSSAFGLLYNDCWIFDRKKGSYESRLGLLFLYKSRRGELSNLAGVRVEEFTKGRFEQAKERVAPPEEHPAAAGVSALRDEARGGNSPRRGLLQIARLLMEDAQGATLVLDTARGNRRMELQRTGLKIAEFCGVPFSVRD